MTVERRKYARRSTGGFAEITAIVGTPEDSLPSGRSTILDCSRGGALISVPSPRRSLFRKLPPCLKPQDSITCNLRLPPTYQEMEVLAEVVRVDRPNDEDTINVGVRFFYDVSRRSHTDKAMGALRNNLGSAAWDSSSSAPALPPTRRQSESARASSDLGKRLRTQSTRLSKASSKRLKTQSARLEKKSDTSKRLQKQSARLEKKNGKASSKRLKAQSARVPKQSARVQKQSARVQKQSARVQKQSARVPKQSARVQKQNEKATSKRLVAENSLAQPARTPSPAQDAPIYFGLAGPESGLYLRGKSQLEQGKVIVELPEHFVRSVDPESVTVHLTPCGGCYGLYLAERTASKMLIRELSHGSSCAPFDYLLIGRRRGTE